MGLDEIIGLIGGSEPCYIIVLVALLGLAGRNRLHSFIHAIDISDGYGAPFPSNLAVGRGVVSDVHAVRSGLEHPIHGGGVAILIH